LDAVDDSVSSIGGSAIAHASGAIGGQFLANVLRSREDNNNKNKRFT